jgi:hypothetical protein
MRDENAVAGDFRLAVLSQPEDSQNQLLCRWYPSRGQWKGVTKLGLMAFAEGQGGSTITTSFL